MKIGTDSVLLGAWTPISSENIKILDIGSGTGILTLMMAQRCSNSEIDAVEIDFDTFEECCYNTQNSQWKKRIHNHHCSIDSFVENKSNIYDIIISNPPFFTEEALLSDKKRAKARFSEFLPFEILIKCVAQILKSSGFFSVIIPFKEEKLFIDLAQKQNLFAKKITHVKGRIDTPIKRSMLLLCFEKTTTLYDEIIIEIERHQYTQDYINLTKEFYLNM